MGTGLTEDMKTDLTDFINGLASGDINPWEGPIQLQDGTVFVTDGERNNFV